MKFLITVITLSIICGCSLSNAQQKNKKSQKSNNTEIQKTMKAIRLLQERQKSIESSHDEIDIEIKELKTRLAVLTKNTNILPKLIEERRQKIYDEMSQSIQLCYIEPEKILAEAEARYPNKVKIEDILSIDDLAAVKQGIDKSIEDFNARYGLDVYDYAIAGLCGIIGGGLDFFYVGMPTPFITKFTTPVNGPFNKATQKMFNAIFPPDKTAKLSNSFKIGSADTSVSQNLIGSPGKVVSPTNHRLRALSHDPILGFLFGPLDMKNNTLTAVYNGKLQRFKSDAVTMPYNSPWAQMRLMLGHLASDVNAPSAMGNRGMGLPVPFMSLLRMVEFVPVSDSTFGAQVEWMYIHGYDFRHFVTMSFPVTVMEVLMRVLYAAKQLYFYDADFCKTIVNDTLPLNLNPRFRVMLSIAYGAFAAVNAGKFIASNRNPLTLNYPAWMGLVWNGVPALKWMILDKHTKLWSGIADKEIDEIKSLVVRLDALEQRAAKLPTQ